MPNQIDVLVITALPMEYDAARAGFSAVLRSQSATWTEVQALDYPYCFNDFETADGSKFRVAVARPLRMGTLHTTHLCTVLVERLKPICVAMCGVCAGDPDKVALGDVVIAELTYMHDEGKITATGFAPDHRQFPLDTRWLRPAQDLRVQGLPSYGTPTEDESELWLLECLASGVEPTRHPAIKRYFPTASWSASVKSLSDRGLIKLNGPAYAITTDGRDHVDATRANQVDAPERLPFEKIVAPMASGNVVVKGGITWKTLQNMGLRTLAGLEMEAAGIACVAELSGMRWIVAKGVMDHADHNKNDRYKPFAARASSEVLARFLSGTLTANDLTRSGAQGAAPVPITVRPRTAEDDAFDEAAEQIRQHAPRFFTLFNAAREAAFLAHLASDRAELIATEVKTVTAADVASFDTEKSTMAIFPVLHNGETRMAKVWNTNDEYFGECAGDMMNGYGVAKAYLFSQADTPHEVSAYSGLLERDRYGPRGVYHFFDRTSYAGAWMDGCPTLGCRKFVGAKNQLACDYYFGHMSFDGTGGRGSRWFPQGEGILVDLAKREIRCVEISGGYAQRIAVQHALTF